MFDLLTPATRSRIVTQPNQSTFVSATLTSFSFLADAYGYSSSVNQDSSVTFVKDTLTIAVLHDVLSQMIYIEVCRTDTGEVYVLHEILNALAPDNAISPQCSSSDNIKMVRCLSQLSHLCQRYLQGIFVLDQATFDKVAEYATSERRRYTLHAQYGTIIDRANRAWEHKEWEAARKLYTEARPALSLTEQRRLDFLTKRNSQVDQ